MSMPIVEYKKTSSPTSMRVALLQFCESLDESDCVALSTGIGLEGQPKKINLDEVPTEPSCTSKVVTPVEKVEKEVVNVVDKAQKVDVVQQKVKKQKLVKKPPSTPIVIRLANVITAMERSWEERRAARKEAIIKRRKALEERFAREMVEANMRSSVVPDTVQSLQKTVIAPRTARMEEELTPKVKTSETSKSFVPRQLAQTGRDGNKKHRFIIKWMFAHSLDIGIVLFSLVVSLLFVSNVLLPTPAKAGALNPIVKFVLNLSLLEFACCVYVFFVFYWVLFKIFIGRTLGQYAIGLKKV